MTTIDETLLDAAKQAGGEKTLLDLAQQWTAPGLSLRARLEGMPPGMLMHSAAVMERSTEAAKAHSAGGKRSKFIPTPEEEAEWGAYRSAEGSLYLPSKNLIRSCIEAAKAFKVPKSRSSFMKAAAAGITVQEVGFPLLDPETLDELTEYKVDIQRAVVQRAAIMRARPLVEAWVVDVEIMVDPDPLPPEIFAQILGYAGARVGVGDQRPERGGQYGKFSVTELEVL